MSVTIRLKRTGRKKAPSYRVVVADQRRKRDGRIIELLGSYEPRKDPISLTIKSDRVAYWIGKGAQPSSTVAQMLKRAEKHAKSLEGAKK